MKERQKKKLIAKTLKKQLKGMSETELYSTIETLLKNTSTELIENVLITLYKEFGFGKKRQERFMAALKKNQQETKENVQQYK
jgi:hypothetical protein